MRRHRGTDRSSFARCGASLLAFSLLAGLAVAEPAARQAGRAPNADPTLRLRTGDVNAATLTNLLRQEGVAFTPDARYVITLAEPLTEDQRAALSAAGVRLVEYVPDNAFVADLSHTTAAELSTLAFVRGVYAPLPAWKIDPELGNRQYIAAERLALAQQGKVKALVTLYPGIDAAAIGQSLAALGDVQFKNIGTDGRADVLAVTMPRTRAADLAALPGVQMIEDSPEYALRNSTARWIVQSNVTNSTPLWNKGLHGEGQIVGHIDGGIDINHCSFSDPTNNTPGPSHRKILAWEGGSGTPNADGHGTHTACTLAGDVNTTGSARGIAYAAKLVAKFYPLDGSESTFYNMFEMHRSLGAFVHSNSWGTDATNAYDTACRGIDSFSFTNDDNLLVFAVSNGSTIRNPENSKNVLAVGAVGDTPIQNFWCSGGTGPTTDGRRRPEIMAPGCNIQSASSGTPCAVVQQSGTSMATPAVSAIATLARQYFTSGFYPSGSATPADAFTPSGPLLKAMCINSAVDATSITGYPSNQEGWGRILADNSFYFAGDTRRLVIKDVRNAGTGALITGANADVRFRVRSSAEPLKVTLVWHDAPASAFTSSAPVNNLDLRVDAPAASYLGNVMSNGESATGGSADLVNNVEQVIVTSPATGVWDAAVLGTNIPVGPQGYAVVVTGDVEPIVCVADFNNDGFLDFSDFDAFVAAFEAGSATSDINADGFLDFTDFDAFVLAFEAGC
ncbi:MAG: S8 family serine peptidase [Planctomycetota bacterium]|nr:S8 family serine peptidase [Planctomycetota bacterium]